MTRLRRILAHPWLALALRLYLGGLFVYASMYKISHPAVFAETIASYQLVPHMLVNPMAAVLPWLELACGLLLVAGVRSKAACVLIMAMLSMFIVALAWVMVMDIPIGCGCFTGQEDEVGPLTMLRDLVWLAMAAHVYRFDTALQLERRFLWAVERAAR